MSNLLKMFKADQSDGWKTDWITFYDDGKWAHDGVFSINKKFSAKLTKLGQGFVK